MLTRLIYCPSAEAPFFTTKKITFDGVSGFAKSRAQENVRRLHESVKRAFHLDPILEVSSASSDELGKNLSAFNLEDCRGNSVEGLFQSSKKFAHGGPYPDLLEAKRGKAKKDSRLQDSGPLIGFVGPYSGKEYPKNPATAYYDFLYLRVLLENSELCQELIDRNPQAFSDIWFNPEKSLNCQAEACAIFSGMMEAGISIPASFEDFVSKVFEK